MRGRVVARGVLAAVLLLGSRAVADPFADQVVAYQIGTGGGAGQDEMPDIVLGPPHGSGAFRGSTNTLSLGLGGWIVLAFTSGSIVDGPGVDFTVFENPFLTVGLVTGAPFAEPGTVSVSDDGVAWRTFPVSSTSHRTTQAALASIPSSRTRTIRPHRLRSFPAQSRSSSWSACP
jgi:hypothetical protein